LGYNKGAKNDLNNDPNGRASDGRSRMEPISSFGYWLWRRRKALDLTQDELARQVGCALGTLKKIETDERRPSKQLAERLADCLEIPAADRPAFLKAARAELVVDRLDLAAQPLGAPAEAPPPSAAPILPRGTVTFLFTDIEGSTPLWQQHPQAMANAIARHELLLRTTIASAGGVVFKTVGDAVYAAFASALDAVAAALAGQRALAAEAWGATGPLHVRMALHTGVVEERAGDYFGLPLSRVTRLLAAGHGGQVLLSHVTQELVRDQLPPGAELRDLGAHRLKDLDVPEQIFQLAAPDLPTDFPALNTLDPRRTNLPAQPTPLIGREREIADVSTLLRRAEVRLVTLTGPGGTGKTRLGLQVAAELLDDFADGSYFVDLAPISDPDLVATALAQTLGVKESGGRPLIADLQAHLREKHLLLLVDNFEQVLEAAPLIAELLAAAPRLKVLVTSREVLHLRGEKEFAVPPLELPDPQRQAPFETLSQYAAVQLFIARALDVKPDFAVTNENAPAVAEICARLDGLPLALELAAARIKLFPPKSTARTPDGGRWPGYADRRGAGSARPPADAAGHHRLELQPAGRGRAGLVRTAGRVRGRMDLGGGRRDCNARTFKRSNVTTFKRSRWAGRTGGPKSGSSGRDGRRRRALYDA
jgi:class 3 adenylate cyclase